MIELEDILFKPTPDCKIHFVTEWERDDAVDAYYSPWCVDENVDRLLEVLTEKQVEFWVEWLE